MAADDREWPFSFVNLCEVAGLGVEAIRRQVLDPMMAPRETAHATHADREAALGKAA